MGGPSLGAHKVGPSGAVFLKLGGGVRRGTSSLLQILSPEGKMEPQKWDFQKIPNSE